MLIKSCASPGFIVPFKKASCIAKSALFGGPRALLKRNTRCSRICRDEKSIRGLSRRSFIWTFSSALAPVLQHLKRTQHEMCKRSLYKNQQYKYCTHKQSLPPYWGTLISLRVSKLVHTLMALHGKFFARRLLGNGISPHTHLRVTCRLPCALTRACHSAYWFSVEPCKYVGRFAALSSSRRSKVRPPQISGRRCFTGF